MTCVRGFSRGDEEVHYHYVIERTPAPTPSHPGRRSLMPPPVSTENDGIGQPRACSPGG